MPFLRVSKNVYAVSGNGYGLPGDAYAYSIQTENGGFVLIDCGIDSFNKIKENMKEAGQDISKLHTLILTHCHIDHVGSAYDFVNNIPNLQVIAHVKEKDVLEEKKGTEKMTAASWYGTHYRPIKITKAITKQRETIVLGGTPFTFIHIPGHTPGSMAITIQDENMKILFGQDIHGPFLKEFGSSIKRWRESMQILLGEKCDILCEGHYGIFYGKEEVERFIKEQLQAH